MCWSLLLENSWTDFLHLLPLYDPIAVRICDDSFPHSDRSVILKFHVGYTLIFPGRLETSSSLVKLVGRMGPFWD